MANLNLTHSGNMNINSASINSQGQIEVDYAPNTTGKITGWTTNPEGIYGSYEPGESLTVRFTPQFSGTVLTETFTVSGVDVAGVQRSDSATLRQDYNKDLRTYNVYVSDAQRIVNSSSVTENYAEFNITMPSVTAQDYAGILVFADGDASKYWGAYVIPPTPGPDTGSTTASTLNIVVADSITGTGRASATYTPSNAVVSLRYSSNSPAYATIDPITGEITVLQTGDVRFTVTDEITGLFGSKVVHCYKDGDEPIDTGTVIDSLSIVVGAQIIGSGYVSSIYTPANAEVDLHYTSNLPAVASVDETTGLVTVHSTGNVTFCVRDTKSGLSDCRAVNVLTPEPGIIPATALTINVADTITDSGVATATYEPANADVSLYYSYEDTDIIGANRAGIDRYTGQISVRSTGTARFCVEDQQTGLKDCKVVNVIKSDAPDTGDTGETVYITALTINVPSSAQTGDYATVTFSPSNALNFIRYSCSDESIATINPETGQITIFKDGTVSFCAVDRYTGISDCKTVTVDYVEPVLSCAIEAVYNFVGNVCNPVYAAYPVNSDNLATEDMFDIEFETPGVRCGTGSGGQLVGWSPEENLYGEHWYFVPKMNLNNRVPPIFEQTGVSRVNIPNCYTAIAVNTFYNCGSLEYVTLPEGLKNIGDAAFEWSGIRELTIPSSVKSIGELAIAFCGSLTGLTFEGITPPSVERYAFGDTTGAIGPADTYPIYVPCEAYSAYINDEGFAPYASRIQCKNVDDKLQLSLSADTYNVYGYKNIKATWEPSSATTNIVFTTTDTTIATVNPNYSVQGYATATVYGHKSGLVGICATDSYTNTSVCRLFNVYQTASSLTLSLPSVVHTGDFATVTFSPSDAVVNIIYASSDESIATINSSTGEITVLQNGTVTIYASDQNSGKGAYKQVTASTGQDTSSEYLTFRILTGGTFFWMVTDNSYAKTIQYQINDNNWVSITSSTSGEPITVESGNLVKFRGDNSVYGDGGIGIRNHFITDGITRFEAEGNIMSLIVSVNFATASLQSPGALCGLFYNCDGLTSADNLLLPDTLVSYCYANMFQGCTGLTQAPELPATALTSNCYYGMFNGCTSLTQAPELPATVMANYCYGRMFYGCTSLTQAPELPATYLAEGCYSYMFYGCISLATAPELPATTLADYCYDHMFNGCTSLIESPILPAQTLVTYCYQSMFDSCGNLSKITCLATTFSASWVTLNWVSGVAASGTFVKSPSMSSWRTGVSGIPSGWTVEDAT